MTRQDIKLIVILIVLYGIAIALMWPRLGSWGLLVIPVLSGLSIVAGIYIVKWIEK